jgi:outer membrane lipoprotein LolB
MRASTPLRRWLRLASLALLALMLCACASPPPIANQHNGHLRDYLHDYRAVLDLNGRLSVLYQHDGKDESLHGKFTWSQGAAATHITLLSPLGQTVAQIALTRGGATLEQAGRERQTAADVDALTASALGWPLPVAGLRDWLQGYAIGVDGTRFIASQQADSVTTGDGWRIRYVTWNDDASPRRIDLKRNTNYAGEVTLRIILEQATTN